MFESFMAIINSGQIQEYVTAALAAVGGFRIFTTITPNTHDNKSLDGILKVLNFFSGAVGKNKV